MYGFEEKKQSRIVNTVVIQLFDKMVKMEGTFVGVLHIPPYVRPAWAAVIGVLIYFLMNTVRTIFSLRVCMKTSLYLPVIKTTVSLTDRQVYKWEMQRSHQTCRKAIILCMYLVMAFLSPSCMPNATE